MIVPKRFSSLEERLSKIEKRLGRLEHGVVPVVPTGRIVRGEPPRRKPDGLSARWAILHLSYGRSLFDKIGCLKGKWQAIPKTRERLLIARMRVEKVSGAEFWALAEKALLPFCAERVASWTPTLDMLLRVPQRGGVDHFERAKEGYYKPDKERGKRKPDRKEDEWYTQA